VKTFVLFCVAVAFLFFYFVPIHSWHNSGSLKATAAQSQIANFQTALDSYRVDVGAYPSTDQGLHALRVNPGVAGWNGPYMPQDIPLDPWGHPYRYIYPGEHGPKPDLICDAPNGTIESWKLRQP
jgi:general secretion pathway protein G